MMERSHAQGVGSQGRTLRDRLSQWDSRLASLSDRQKDGFMELSSAASFRPLPTEVGETPARYRYRQGVLTPIGAVLTAETRDTICVHRNLAVTP